mgnify:FL=1
MTISNKYKVPKRQWRKWSRVQRLIFNETYGYASRSQQAFNAHPETSKLRRRPWKTVCWNIAWVAAGCHVEL